MLAESEVRCQHGHLMPALNEAIGQRAHLHHGSATVSKREVGLDYLQDAHSLWDFIAHKEPVQAMEQGAEMGSPEFVTPDGILRGYSRSAA